MKASLKQCQFIDFSLSLSWTYYNVEENTLLPITLVLHNFLYIYNCYGLQIHHISVIQSIRPPIVKWSK